MAKLKEDNSGSGCLFYKGLPNEGTKWGTTKIVQELGLVVAELYCP